MTKQSVKDSGSIGGGKPFEDITKNSPLQVYSFSSKKPDEPKKSYQTDEIENELLILYKFWIRETQR